MVLNSSIKSNKNYIIIAIIVIVLLIASLVFMVTNNQSGSKKTESNSNNTNMPTVQEKQTTGTVTAVNDTNITIKTEDGVSFVVYFTGSTSITKAGTFSRISEVLVDSNVIVTGITNADGTISCSAIAIK